MSERDPQTGGRNATGTGAENVLQQQHTQRHLYLMVGIHAALVVGIAVTALLHDSLAPSNSFGTSAAASWTSSLPVFAPLVAGALAFNAGRDLSGQDGLAASFVGGAVGYLILFVGAYAINDLLLDITMGKIEIGMRIGIAVGIGVTAALVAYVVDNYEDWL